MIMYFPLSFLTFLGYASPSQIRGCPAVDCISKDSSSHGLCSLALLQNDLFSPHQEMESIYPPLDLGLAL